ncbi:hypothetical protein GCM10008014_09130 [Paenibacillus silvae]|uniref:DUF465 domain-containing protein n=1 Tax=Paenibacillus silvae TaxID=1325358 RepID=A0ABQ1Z468_9BACL|nr:hypothetical protein [Paenibacillus silvae]GGH46456.1 hypothetical protein GCM10008014_09130 [Paenibacillus silvae]
MISDGSLFDEIMSLSTTDIPPYRAVGKVKYQKKMRNLRQTNTITTELESLYNDLVKEGSRLDITIERRMKIRKELALIRKQKRLMDQEITRQVE